MKLKRENGYWTLTSSTLGDYIRGSSFLKKHKKGLATIVVIVWFYLCVYLLISSGLLAGLNPFIGVVVIFVVAFGTLGVIDILLGRAVYGSFRGRLLYDSFHGRFPRKVDLPRAEFHTLGTCQNYGKRILDMVKELNVGDHYIFLLNFHNLFYHDEHRLENPDQALLNGIGRAVRVLPERQRSTTWTKNPIQGLAGGLEAGREAGEKAVVDNITKKLGGLPEPREAVSIITKEYLPELTREFPRDVGMLIAVVVGTAQNYTAVFPFDSRVVNEEDAVRVASNPTRENVVEYCSKFAGLSVEEPVTRRKGLMED